MLKLVRRLRVNSHPCSVVKSCRLNKDYKNVGTVSEGVSSWRDFPSVKLSVCVVINGEFLVRTNYKY